jgi:hypothetical protein
MTPYPKDMDASELRSGPAFATSNRDKDDEREKGRKKERREKEKRTTTKS